MDVNEQLLAAWVEMSTVVVNSRLVSELSYNEALVCRLLYQNLPIQDEKPLNATRLCEKTGMLKSQMNRTLGSLEAKGLVIRRRNEADRRQVLVTLNPNRTDSYQRQHREILALIDGIVDRLGEEESRRTAEILSRLAATVETTLKATKKG